ncbi:MAG: glutathione S-transferase [Alphaproteobacteria bacterium]|nr:glutathione S-transferase [Alphaproteobacteria bacterium]
MADTDLTLWGAGTLRSMRAHWMLAEFGLDYVRRPIQSRTGETYTDAYLALNPRHKIPTLVHGSVVLAESAAIINYLSRAFPAPDGFYVPGDVAGRGKLDEWCFFIMTELDAHCLYVIRRHSDLADLYGASPVAVDAAKAYFAEQIAAGISRFDGAIDTLMPEGMSVADILMVTTLDYALKCDIAIPEPLLDYRARHIERPAYKQAEARNRPDAG